MAEVLAEPRERLIAEIREGALALVNGGSGVTPCEMEDTQAYEASVGTAPVCFIAYVH